MNNNFDNNNDFDSFDGFDGFQYGGFGFDSDSDFDFDKLGEPCSPEEPEQKLEDFKRDDPKNYDKIVQIICYLAVNRNKRVLKMFGSSAGVERYMHMIEEDIDAGFCKLMNTPINGKLRTCLFEFDSFTGQYTLSVDN